MLDPKGNLNEDVQPAPIRCDDLSRHRWAECLRVLSDHERYDGRRQQALYRRAHRKHRYKREKAGHAPKKGTPPSSSLRPTASRCSTLPASIVVRNGKGGAS
jgi:hypothetical protein